MKKFLAVLLTLLALTTSSEAANTYTVKRVYDGDTLVLENDKRVRLIGVDTPEMRDKNRNLKDAIKYGLAAKTVDAYADKAKFFVKDAVEGKRVRLEYGKERKDKYGRTLAYVYRVPDNYFVNAEVVKQGYGFAFTRFPFKYRERFKEYEREAKAGKKGLWGG